MAGYIAEFFGYNAEDHSTVAMMTAAKKQCPFTGLSCSKIMARDKLISGVCAVRQKTEGSPKVICCPIRLYADNYKILHLISKDAFKADLNLYAGRTAVEKAKLESGAVAVFGKGWGRGIEIAAKKRVRLLFCGLGTGQAGCRRATRRIDSNRSPDHRYDRKLQ